jgi:hypothetical protein
MSSYAFTVEMTIDGPVADWFLDITPMMGRTAAEFDTACNVLDKLSDEPNASQDMRQLPMTLHNMVHLRSRFTSLGGAYLVTIEDGDITRDDLNTILRRKSADGTLRTFLEEASI